ncbi:hypothetical protein HNY73_001045 [Argiope bruennichi]|uniref:Uncharacterized protein n=1 Tax=Argiope bruennichi TaxID=94029 RepID=A0A8T0G4A9_ARGBR|nr:hypothetical protein HNY73_001045 [Argiope bruennichi]
MGIHNFTKLIQPFYNPSKVAEFYDCILVDAQSFIYEAINYSLLPVNSPEFLHDVCKIVVKEFANTIAHILNSSRPDHVQIIISFDGEGVPMKWPTQRKRRSCKKFNEKDVYRFALFGNNMVSIGLFISIYGNGNKMSNLKLIQWIERLLFGGDVVSTPPELRNVALQLQSKGFDIATTMHQGDCQSKQFFFENKGSMWWPVVVFILLCYYYFFVSSSIPIVEKPKTQEPTPKFTSSSFVFNQGKVEYSNLQGGFWQFELNDNFYFHNGQIIDKDECFGKPSGTLIKAQGKNLYHYIQQEQLNSNKNGNFKIHVQEALQHGHIFYFKCHDNHIESLSTCPPGQIFEQSCVSINPCSHQPDGTLIADSFDKQYYYMCPKGRFKCPPGTFFLLDACHSESKLEQVCLNDPKFTFSINANSFIHCIKGKPQIVTCPPGNIVFKHKCIPDVCMNQPDGTKIPFPKENLGPFLFSTGYYTCKENQIKESTECPTEWDKYNSKGDNILFLPQVFHNGKCSIPEFCVNVSSNDPDIVVPAYDFTKNVKNWQNSLLFDRAIGFKCRQNQKIQFNAPPGQHIYDFKLTSACDAPGKRVVIGNQFNRYYDCDKQTIVSCPINSFFDGTLCKSSIPNAHKYKNLDIFKFNNLKFNWVEPWNYSKEASVETTCQHPESIYVSGYNICAHPDCHKFPFLKQLKAHIQVDQYSKCTFQNGKISKVKTARKKHFNFWTQRKSIQPEQCIPGSRIKSGHFILDSVLYATCDSKQPFVFCPSAETSHIAPIENSFACVPKDNVFESILKANTSETFLENHLDYIIPSPGSILKINGKTHPYNPNGIKIDNNPVAIWSDKDVRLIFKMLVNYPPNTYFENKQLKAYKDPNRIFVTRYMSGSTKNAIDFCSYNVQESVDGFRPDAN